jgi:hypothetical protein
MALVSHSLKWLFWGNFWISLGASGAAYFFCKTYFGLTITQCVQYALLVFFSTLTVYNLHRLIKHTDVKYCYTSRHFWIHKHRHVITGLIILSVLCVFWLGSFIISPLTLLWLVPLGVVILAYPPVLSKFKGIRSIPLVKNFTIAFGWTAVILLVPYINFEIPSALGTFPFLIMGFGFFVLALTIPFDLRDSPYDTITTLGNRFSRKINKSIAISLLVFSAGFFYFGQFGMLSLLPFIGSVSILFEHQYRKEFYYDFFVDGLFLLFPILVWF